MDTSIESRVNCLPSSIPAHHPYLFLAAVFSNNGQFLATGSVDGIIEVYDPITCKISTQLSYQNND